MKTGLRAVLSGVAVSTAAVLLLSVKVEAPVRTTVCEVARQPDRFDGKIVRIRGNVVSGMETGGLSDSSCSAFILVDNFAILPSGLQGQFAFVKSIEDLKQPDLLKWRRVETSGPESWNENKPYRTLLHYLGKKLRVGEDRRICYHCPLYEVTATMTGRIDHLETHMVAVRFRPGAAMRTYFLGFGHLNAALTRLALQSLSDVIAKPIDPSVYKKNR